MTDSPIQELIKQLLQLIQNFVNGQTTASMGASTKLPKVAPPSIYNGNWMKLDKFLAQCKLYLALCHSNYPDNIHKILFILSYMKEGTAGPWVTQKIDHLLDLPATLPMLSEFIEELKTMFADPNREASAQQKLSETRQGSGSINTVIQQFKLYSPCSKLGGAGLVNKFKWGISYRRGQAIYSSFPLPETWDKWKERASVLNNKMWQFDHTQAQFR